MLKSAHIVYSNRAERDKAAAPYFSSVGENIVAFSGSIDYQNFIDYLRREKQHYSYPIYNSGKDCSHYKQVRCEMYLYHVHVYVIGRYSMHNYNCDLHVYR